MDVCNDVSTVYFLIMMIKEIRKRVYLKADQEERLALIKDDMGALRPSLFANVPPFLRFVPPNSLRGRGVKGRILPEGMEKMGWYNVVSCQTYNHQCIYNTIQIRNRALARCYCAIMSGTTPRSKTKIEAGRAGR